MARWLSGFMVGGAIGAVVALLYAPRTGEDTRNMIRERSYETRDKVLSAYDEGRARAERLATEVSDQAKTKARRLMSVGEEAVTAHKAQLEEDLRKAQDAVKTQGPVQS